MRSPISCIVEVVFLNQTRSNRSTFYCPDENIIAVKGNKRWRDYFGEKRNLLIARRSLIIVVLLLVFSFARSGLQALFFSKFSMRVLTYRVTVNLKLNWKIETAL